LYWEAYRPSRNLKLISIFCLYIIFWLFSCSSAPRYLYTSPKTGATSKDNRTLLLLKDTKRTAIMTASFYGEEFHGRLTSNGDVFDMYGLSAAHKSLPFGTILRVTYPKTNKSVDLVINDRGPFIPGRDIDLSYGAAAKIGLVVDGVGQVKVKVLKWGDGETRKK